ncbi:MAG: hypothetical protein LBE84_02295 [Planctomycetota bacterium]|nr:hypothetical protein [Planctomycetota bacterium]
MDRGREARVRAAMTRVTKRVEKERRASTIRKGILLGLGGLLAILLVLALTPVGPNWYYSFLQGRKMSDGSTVRTGYLGSLYGLGVFYAYTGRAGKAADCLDEIGLLYFGVGLKDISRNPDAIRSKRNGLMLAADSGSASGPPLSIPAGDLRYVGKAVMQLAEIYLGEKNRQYAYRLYKEAYIGALLEEHPDACDPADAKQASDYVSAYSGKR